MSLAAFCCARLAASEGAVRVVLDVVAMSALAYVDALALDGVALALVWVAQGLALANVADRTDDDLAAGGAAAFLGLAAAHLLVFEAPPDSLVSGVENLGPAALGLGALAGACLAWARLAALRLGAAVPILQGVAAAVLVYLGSVAIVDVFASGGVPAAAGLEGLGAEQQGQVALSAFWGLTGLGALVAGLVRDRREARLAGFGLLALALVKVFAFDLTALDSVYRVLSLVALGLLLLVGAFAYQRMRPGGGGPPPGGGPPATAS